MRSFIIFNHRNAQILVGLMIGLRGWFQGLR